MKRYAAFLRGVTPTNCRMAELKRAFESAGFKEVRTLLSSGNVVFEARSQSTTALEKKAEAAVAKTLGKPFLTLVRSIDDLEALLASDPYRGAGVSNAAKRIVTFLRSPPATKLELPFEREGARLVRIDGLHLFSAYIPLGHDPLFMTLIERALGKEQTTRTWQTVEKVARALKQPLGKGP